MQKVLLRYLGYAGVVLAGSGALLALAHYYPGSLQFDRQLPGNPLPTSEFSVIEILQNILLLVCAAIFGWIALRDRLRRPMALGFVALFSLMLLREIHFFLDYYLVLNLWRVLAATIVSVAIVYLGRNRHRVVQGWRRSWPSTGLAIIMAGLILLLPYAQLMGFEQLWSNLMDDSNRRIVRLITQEFLELGAYIVITIGAAELLYTWSRLPRIRSLHEQRPRRH